MHRFLSKHEMALFIPLLACMLCFHENGFSQNNTGKKNPVCQFGNVPNGQNVVITNYDLVLFDPQFKWNMPGWETTTFTLSFQPKGKDYYGPFTTKGGKLTEKEIDIFKHYRDIGTRKLQVFIEDIKAQGPDRQLRTYSPFIFTIEQR